MTADLAGPIWDAVRRNVEAAWRNDLDAYRATTAADVSVYEWYVAPARIDGLDFHLRELQAARQTAAPAGYAFELEFLQPRLQCYGAAAIATYTLLTREITPAGVTRKASHETRVFHNFGSEAAPEWKLVHCHKSPVVTPASRAVLQE